MMLVRDPDTGNLFKTTDPSWPRCSCGRCVLEDMEFPIYYGKRSAEIKKAKKLAEAMAAGEWDSRIWKETHPSSGGHAASRPVLSKGIFEVRCMRTHRSLPRTGDTPARDHRRPFYFPILSAAHRSEDKPCRFAVREGCTQRAELEMPRPEAVAGEWGIVVVSVADWSGVGIGASGPTSLAVAIGSIGTSRVHPPYLHDQTNPTVELSSPSTVPCPYRTSSVDGQRFPACGPLFFAPGIDFGRF